MTLLQLSGRTVATLAMYHEDFPSWPILCAEEWQCSESKTGWFRCIVYIFTRKWKHHNRL